jgi:hypothetical protein
MNHTVPVPHTNPARACLALLTLLLVSAAPLGAAEFHVAPAGSDANPGTAEKPFATLERARDAVRTLKAGNGLPAGRVDVVVHGGEYVLQQTLELTPLDSGAKGRPVRWRAAQGESPVLSSARSITGWKKFTEPNAVVTDAARDHLWVADVPMFVIYMDDWTGRAVVESNIAWSPGSLLDNSHISTPAARPAPSGVRASGKTLVQRRNNVITFPAQPPEFAERLAAIQGDAKAEGGWPKAVTADMTARFLGETTPNLAKRPPALLAPGAWVKAADVLELYGPRHDDRREYIGWIAGCQNVVFGPYAMKAGAFKKLELEVGVDPNSPAARFARAWTRPTAWRSAVSSSNLPAALSRIRFVRCRSRKPAATFFRFLFSRDARASVA